MDTNSIISKAEKILAHVDDFSSFEDKYPNHLRLHGERILDAAIFVFDIGENYKLVVHFAEAEFESFSIIHNSIDQELLNYI